MSIASEFVIMLLNPWVTWLLALTTLVFWLYIFGKYSHICLNRYDMLLVALAIGGTMAFEMVLLTYTISCGSLTQPCTNLMLTMAFSRVMRVIMSGSLLWVGHAALNRQRKAEDAMHEVGYDGGV